MLGQQLHSNDAHLQTFSHIFPFSVVIVVNLLPSGHFRLTLKCPDGISIPGVVLHYDNLKCCPKIPNVEGFMSIEASLSLF